MHSEDARPVHSSRLCELALGGFAVWNEYLVFWHFSIVEVIVVGGEVGIVPGLGPLIESLHAVSQTIGVFLQDRLVLESRSFEQV